MKFVLSTALFLLLSASLFAETPTETHALDDMFLTAFNGNAKLALEIANSLSNDDLTPEDIEKKERFIHRFGSTEEIIYTEESKLVNDLMNIYQPYWHKVLMQEVTPEQGLNEFLAVIFPFLMEKGYVQSGETQDDVLESARAFLSDLLLKDGYHSQIGQTGHMMDIYLWKQEERKSYTVTLPEATTDAEVVFLKNIVTLGHYEYATLGRINVGGWAIGTDIYCPEKEYDIQGELFSISLLTHETQHCTDYQSFPKLSPIDLEYRAKLAELSNAQETVYIIIERYINSQSQERGSAHPFANHCIIRDLSANIFDNGIAEDIEQWKEIPVDTINATAVKLLSIHTENLNNIGAENVVEFIQ